VLIILVVHKRKNGFSTDENDEVMGASDIVNLASVVISYGKDKVIDDSQRMCKLTKNRIYGKLLQEGTIMDYNERSKRIYEHLRSETDGFDFNWDISTQETENGIVITSEIMEESPFD
jgi:hypothetical protein